MEVSHRKDRRQWLPGMAERPTASGEAGPPCLACGGATVISPGTPPHHARIDCTRCKSWRWAPRPRPERGNHDL